jgi:hypothetical protein
VLGHVLNLGGDEEYGTVIGASLVLAAHLALVFALVALYAAQADRSGLPGSLGRVLSVSGTTLVCGVVLVEVAGVSGAEVDAVLASGLSGALSVLGGLALIVGLLLFGIAMLQAGVFPRLAGLLLIIGDVVFAAASVSGSATLVVEVIGAAITCVAFVWLGLALLSGRSGESAQQTARVS